VYIKKVKKIKINKNIAVSPFRKSTKLESKESKHKPD
jgi:hypothetical protein